MDLSTYYTTLKTLWDELDGSNYITICCKCDCCKAIDTKADHAKIIKFLAGLNESYAVIKCQIVMKKHVPDLSEIYNLFDHDFNQRNIIPVHNVAAFQVAASFPSVNNAQSTSTPKHVRLICTHCGYNGHTVETCYKIHGYPVDFIQKPKQQSDKYQNKRHASAKPIVAQIALDETSSSVFGSLTKDQIAGVIAQTPSLMYSD